MLKTASSIPTIKLLILNRPFFLPLRQKGFTLVELVATLIILGILSVVAISRFNSTDFDARAFSDQTLAMLRYAQKAAIAQRRTVCVTYSAVGTVPAAVTLTIAKNFGGACDTDLSGPNGTAPYKITAPSGVGFSTLTPASTSSSFNALGQSDAARTIQVSGVQNAIKIEQETGYVH